MRKRQSDRSRAARVAMIAAGVGIVIYVVSVLILNEVLVQRLTASADRRLNAQLTVTARVLANSGGLPPRGVELNPADTDRDDVPIYLWLVTPHGALQKLTRSAPHLPSRFWTSTPRSVVEGVSTFRVVARRNGANRLVAAESLSAIYRVRSLLQIVELIFGSVLLLLMLGAAFIVGRRALAPVARAQRQREEFTADASHELRTPITVIEAEVEIALSQERTVDSYRATLERIGDEGRRLKSIVDDLLWLARTDSNAERTVTPVNLAESARVCVERLQPLGESRGVRITLHVDGVDHTMRSSTPAEIDRLLGVLIDNGAKFAADAGHVAVTVRDADRRLTLIVEDDGPGLTSGDTSRIFHRFHRSTSATHGTGLGLAIADTVVQASGGSWRLERSELGGARFEVTWRRTFQQ